MEQPGEHEHETRLKQQQALAAFGAFALTSDDLDEILTEACRLVGHALDTDAAKVVELCPDGSSFIVRAGVGWQPGVVGHRTMSAGSGSPAGHALDVAEPTISADRRRETRFAYPDFVIEHGIMAMVNVPIIGIGGRRPFGVLEVDSRKPRSFSDSDVAFLSAYANLLAAAVERFGALQRAQDHAALQEMLVDELQHRSRNLLAVVNAIASSTLSASEARAEFEARLAALSRVQGYVSARKGPLDLKELIEEELYAHGVARSARIDVSGPAVRLPAEAVQLLALALHELATNAVKHGVLARRTGRLSVHWRVAEDGADGAWLGIEWREQGVPVASHGVGGSGFGRTLIETALPYQLGAATDFKITSDGIHCSMKIPLSDGKSRE